MATEFCQKCKKEHPGRACDYDEQGACAEMNDAQAGDKLRETEPPNNPEADHKSR